MLIDTRQLSSFFGSIIHTSKRTNTLVELERAPNRHTPLSLTIKSPATRLTAKANNKTQKKSKNVEKKIKKLSPQFFKMH